MDPNQQQPEDNVSTPDVTLDAITPTETPDSISATPVQSPDVPVTPPQAVETPIQPQAADGLFPASASTPQVSTLPQQPIQQDSSSAPFPNQANNVDITPTAPIPTDKKPNKKLIISLIAGVGGLILVGVTILVLVLFVFGGGRINSISELRDAIENQRAINCTMTVSVDMHGMSMLGMEDSEIEVIIRADNGWNNFYMSVPAMLGMEAWLIRDGNNLVQYTRVMGMNARTTISEADFARVTDSMIDEAFDIDQVSSIDCEPNRRANFDLPSGVNWEDQEFTGFDDDWHWDDDDDWHWDDNDDWDDWDFDFDFDDWDFDF